MDSIKPQLGQAHQNEALLKDGTEWLHFTNPHRLILAETIEEVIPALREVERLAQENQWHAAGFLSYEAASAFDAVLQTRALNADYSAREFPYLWFGLYPPPRRVSLPKPERPREILEWQPTIGRETYDAAIGKIKEHIAEGRTYQVNYTMRLESLFTGDPWEFFLHLAYNQNHHGAYIDTGQHVICSASPELFFQLDSNTITCRPMKGTTSRGRITTEDRERSEWLRHSEKNRAENVMIVDMIRNDLGRIAKTGSVSVLRLFETERYPTLWQMTSTVTAQTDASLTEVFAALFPSASITGAPKVSTMKLIAGLESTARRIYTGSIGYISPGRRATFNVAIRTTLIDREHQRAEYGVGGGIVWDSTSTDEYSEALLKAQVLTQQPQPFSLLETVLWTPEERFVLRKKHMERVLDSADYFDIPLRKETLEEYLDQLSSRFHAPQRVRVLVNQHGELSAEYEDFYPLEDNGALKAGLSREPVSSSNVFLFHKTTQRDVYQSAWNGFERLDDVLLYNEKGELTEFTIGNLVVELDGRYFTPPISCGVLAGTFRAHLLETGKIQERIISLEVLSDCTQIFRINSIRGWQTVEIQNEATI